MYWLVEDIEQLKVFYNSGYKEAFVEVIPFNDKIHPAVNDVSLVYLRPIGAHKGYILCVDHSIGITLLLLVQFGQIRSFLKAKTLKFSFVYIFSIKGSLRDREKSQHSKFWLFFRLR